MSRQYQDQDPNYLGSHYQPAYPYPTQPPAQQSGQYIQPGQPLGQPIPITRDNSSHHRDGSSYTSSSYQDGSQHHRDQPSGRRHSSRSPYAPPVPFPEPGSSPGYPQTYISPSQTTANFPVGTSQVNQQDRLGLYSSGYPPSTSDSHRFNAQGGSITGGGSNLYAGAYNATLPTQHQDWNAQAAGYDEEHDARPKAPGYTPSGMHRAQAPCRYPRCHNAAFFDRRVNELREWCSDDHMRAAIAHRVEKPCKLCGQWPRRNGHKYCSGNYCRFPSPQGR